MSDGGKTAGTLRVEEMASIKDERAEWTRTHPVIEYSMLAQ